VGTITGGAFVAPAVTASTNVTVTATSIADSTKSASAVVTVLPVVKPQQLAIETSSISSAEAGQPYQASLSATGGQTPYKWSVSGNLPKGVSLSSGGILSGSTSSTGNFAFTATVTDSASNSAHQALTLAVSNTSGNFDGPAELPRVQMKWTLADTPAPGKTIPVNAGGSLVSALAGANCGDTIELQAGATFDGSVNLPAKPCDDQHWIIIRTSAPDSALPAEGQRLTPCYAGVASLPNRPAYSCPKVQNVLARLTFSQNAGSGPILFAGGANHYRFVGLEITRPLKSGSIVALISSLPEAAVDHIVIDRCWIHGTAQDETRRGININGITYGAIVDSYINDFHCVALTGGCVDSQAIGGGSGDIATGPLQIQDNFLEAASENILFGGGNATIVPQDITIHGNHFYKPPQWMKGTKNFVGGPTGNPFIVKNHIELKNASRLLIENNIFEYTWGGFSQSGFSVMITPRNNYDQITKQGNGCAVCETTDLTFRYNIFRHVGAGIAIANPLTANEMAAAGGRDSIHDDVLEDVDAQTYNGSGSLFMVFNSWNKNVLNSISIRHVTGFPDVVHGTVMSVSNSLDYPTMFGFTFEDNLIVSSKYPVWSAGAFGSRNCAISDVPVTVVSTCFQNWTFTNNVLAAVWPSFLSPKWPANNMFPATVDDVGFTNFNNGNGGNYLLLSNSPYKNKASDGTDPGADISALEAATQAVE
jgi:hypothetical protein